MIIPILQVIPLSYQAQTALVLTMQWKGNRNLAGFMAVPPEAESQGKKHWDGTKVMQKLEI